ncbi:MAG: urea ABC transporter substrate-binding protein [Trueperaceae bacterium]|nr:urea ABC transporter substrate-binding protein [Trueperaceae bacterium]
MKQSQGHGSRMALARLLALSLVLTLYLGIALAQDTVKVGVLHSLSGTMAISEVTVANATELAIKEINESGGVLGMQIEYIVEDGGSEPAVFAQKAQKLIEEDGVVTVFGGWTSASRQAMLPVFENTGNLLWYPVQFEGNECSPNIIYSGAQPNQQALPALDWAFEQGYTKFFLIGSDYVYPQTANFILNTHIADRGGEVLGEEYIPLGDTNFSSVINKVRAAEPELIFNTLNGDSNVAFFKQMEAAGYDSESLPIMSFSIAEQEAMAMGVELVAGNYAAWNYFQSLDNPANAAFVEAYKAAYGADAVITDPMIHGYIDVYLWKAAVEKAGSFDTDAVRAASYGLVLEDTPMGTITVDSNQSIYQTVYVGKIGDDGQFEIIWDSGEPVKPEPYDPLAFPGNTCDFAN